MEARVRLLPETLQRNRERRCKAPCEKADCRRYPQHTLAPNDAEPELPLEKPDGKP